MSEPQIPTKDEIAALPWWARVAFAARCARRVLPLFQAGWPSAPKKHVHAVTMAVETAERSATDAADAADTAYAADAYAAYGAAEASGAYGAAAAANAAATA